MSLAPLPSTARTPLPQRVLCVCLGNICRSPTAQAVLEAAIAKARLPIAVDSAGTNGLHTGDAPDPRSQRYALKRGHDLSRQRSRQVADTDFEHFDLLLAMDETNLRTLQRQAERLRQAGHPVTADIALFSAHDPNGPFRPVPDPYYGGSEGFEAVLDQVESAAQGWIQQWQGHQPKAIA